MQIEYRPGDLLKSDIRHIAHGCNAQGVMGSGIARQIKEQYPGAYAAYVRTQQISSYYLGQVIPWGSSERVVFNCITQEYYGRDSIQYVSYDAVEACMMTLNAAFQGSAAVGEPLVQLGMPTIGCGLGGGDWGIVSAIIEKNATSFQPVVYIP